MKIYVLKQKSVSLPSIFLLLLLFILPQKAYFQKSNNVFAVSRVISDVKKRYKLNSQDVTKIKPLINRENNDIIQLYARFSTEEPEYSHRLWQEMIVQRRDFETRKVILTKRQKVALRAARTGMEKRLLNYLVGDYVNFLGQLLNLGEFEFNDVQDIFETDKDKKYGLATNYLFNSVLLQKELEIVSEETERAMRKILSNEQWRDYRSLSGPDDSVASL